MKVKVLVIDHQEITLNGIEKIISGTSRFEVYMGKSKPVNPLTLTNVQSLNIALVDIMNPELNIMDLIEAYLVQVPHLKILGMSNTLKEDVLKSFLQKGGHGFILKSATEATLLKGLEQIADYSSFFQEESFYEWAEMVKSSSIVNQELKSREIQIIQLICQEKTTNEIGEILCLSKRTVETHLQNIKKKIHCSTKVGIVKFAYKNKLVDD